MKLKFRRDTAFRKQFFVPDSFAHPAKMDAQLLIRIVEEYTKPGEVILDPMAGSGTTMLACTLGRNVILVELEEKFCKMCCDNWEVVKMRPQLGSTMGECQIIQGDARNLEGILADKIITSPPYSDNPIGGGLNTKPPREGHNDQSGRSKQSPSQAGAGKYDKIMTSPPFGQAQEGSGLAKNPPATFRGVLKNFTQKQGNDINNIANLPYGNIDSIITSPPYEGSVNVPDSKPEARAERLKKAGYDPKDYQGGKGRNLQQDWSYHPVDAVITSPPYEGQIHPTHETIENVIASNDPKHLGQFSQPMLVDGYGGAAGNIGNLKSDSYLSAMLQVYAQCYKVLKSGGLMILVTKNFIRNKKIVRLDEDTIKLCEQAGFKFRERHYRELPAQSFWRVIYKQKYPDAPEIKHEDILVFSKYS